MGRTQVPPVSHARRVITEWCLSKACVCRAQHEEEHRAQEERHSQERASLASFTVIDSLHPHSHS